MHKIKKGDEIIVRSGKDKGRRGNVTQVIQKDNDVFFLIEGINTVKKHVKANPNTGERGGVVIKTMPIRGCKVQMYDQAGERGRRVGIRTLADGRKVRYFKATNEVIDV